ncbi:MYXO-CTERM sorting domain-containing protein [Pendulispora brunnea]|uniref:MYXO-CTERM sorting domain-containing protein n=1 Tax=Pendulispora brunnea TaxID=2905690 RepID=A0ABZ2K2J1_9BACT
MNDGAGGRNGCPEVGGAACIGAAGEIGQCRHSCLNVPLLCSGAGPRSKCEVLGAEFARCVECQTNADCSTGAPVCDTGTQTCVQCRANNDCATNQNGPICRGGASSQASCGCNSDADCGAGRVCQDTVKVCLPGCRGNSPNACPPGSVCNASGGGTGQCVPGTDGGVDAGDAGNDGGAGDGSVSDGSTGDGSVEDGSTGDGSVEDGSTGDGSVEDGSTGDGSTGDGSTGDGGADAADGSIRADAGDGGDGGSGGNDAGGNDNDGNYMTSLEGGGCDCSVVPSEDSLPIGGLLAVGGFFAFFTRRRTRNAKKDEGTQQR